MRIADWLLWLGYFTAFTAIIIGWGWTIVLYVAGNHYLTLLARRPPGREEDFLWVFLVPALNEGVTIADSVERLRGVAASHKLIVVINDGSEDNTADVLASIAGPDLEVFTRTPPNARKGKAAALNAAFAHVRDKLLTQPQWDHWQPQQTIFGIVDADGRLAAGAPEQVSRHFADPRVGGVQCNVHIYNQESWLTREQGIEFQVFGGLFQLGRSRWGAAFMGGNGQFNRMSALQSIATDEGPWSHYLTEDQELGLRLLQRGWRGEHCPNTQVSQQGLNSLKRLYKQRTRWFQGNLQVLRDFRRVYAHFLVGKRRFDAAFTLIQPILQIVVGVALIVSILLAVVFGVPYLPFGDPVLLVFFLILSTGPTGLAVLVLLRGRGWRGIPYAVARTFPYIAYTWLMWPVVARGLYQEIRGNTVWDKTAREVVPVAPPPPDGD